MRKQLPEFPSACQNLERVWLFIGMALAESMGIFGLVMGFLILFT